MLGPSQSLPNFFLKLPVPCPRAHGTSCKHILVQSVPIGYCDTAGALGVIILHCVKVICCLRLIDISGTISDEELSTMKIRVNSINTWSVRSRGAGLRDGVPLYRGPAAILLKAGLLASSSLSFLNIVMLCDSHFSVIHHVREKLLLTLFMSCTDV